MMMFLSTFQGTPTDEYQLHFRKMLGVLLVSGSLFAVLGQTFGTLDRLLPSSRPPNPSIVIRQPVGRTVRDSWTSLAHHHLTTPHDANRHRSSPSIEWHRRVERSNRVRRKDICFVAPNLHCHCGRARKQRCEEDFVLNNDIWARGWLPRRVSCSTVARARGGRRETVPEMELLFSDTWLAGLVGLDIVGEEIAPVIVGHVVHVCLRALGNTLFFDRADVMGLSVVIPGKNLLCQSPFQFRQVRRCSEIPRCLPLQIEAALGAPAASDCATYHPLARPSSCCTGAGSCRTTEKPASCRPWEPQLTAKLNQSHRFCQRRPEPMRPS